MFLPFESFLIHKLSLFSQIHFGFIFGWSADLPLDRLSVLVLVMGCSLLGDVFFFIVFWIIPSIYSISWLQIHVFRQTVQLANLFNKLLRFL